MSRITLIIPKQRLIDLEQFAAERRMTLSAIVNEFSPAWSRESGWEEAKAEIAAARQERGPHAGKHREPRPVVRRVGPPVK